MTAPRQLKLEPTPTRRIQSRAEIDAWLRERRAALERAVKEAKHSRPA